MSAPAEFVAALLRVDLTVIASASGDLDLYRYREEPRHPGDSYSDKPADPEAIAMKARFHALTDSERREIAVYVRALPRSGAEEGRG